MDLYKEMTKKVYIHLYIDSIWTVSESEMKCQHSVVSSLFFFTTFFEPWIEA